MMICEHGVYKSSCRNCIRKTIFGYDPEQQETNKLHIKIKKLVPEAVIPRYAKLGDAGMDITAISRSYDIENDVIVYNTGLSIEIPQGYAGFIFPRSSNYKIPLSLSNCVGVVDSGYRGEIRAMFRSTGPSGKAHKNYRSGDRIMQLVIMPVPYIEFVEVQELSISDRGTSGFGSSGQ